VKHRLLWLRSLLACTGLGTCAGCLLASNLHEGLAAGANIEEELPPLLRTGSIELWALGPVDPEFNTRLFDNEALDGTPRTIIDPFPFSDPVQPEIGNYLVSSRADGTLDAGALWRRGLVSNFGREPVASAHTDVAYFQIWCKDTAYMFIEAFPLPESVWCTSPATIAVGASPYTAVLVSLTKGGPIYDLDFTPDVTKRVAPSTLTLPSGVDVGTIRFIDRPTLGVLAVVTETNGAWVYMRTDGATRLAGATLSGGPAGSKPVRRQADGTLRVVTLDGLYRWDADGTGTVTLLASSPLPSVLAPWTSANGEGGALAREVAPNPLDPTLEVPVAVQARVLVGDAFVVYDVPTTPCDTSEACRAIGESRVIGLVGNPAAPYVVYELWSWYLTADTNVKGVYATPLISGR